MSDILLLFFVFGVMGAITSAIAFIMGYNYFYGDPEVYEKPKKVRGMLLMAFSPLPGIAGILFPLFVLMNKG